MRQIGSRGPHVLGLGLGDLLPLTVESLIGSLSLSEAFKCYRVDSLSCLPYLSRRVCECLHSKGYRGAALP